MTGKVRNQIQVSEKYRKKIRLFFLEDWILLSIVIIVMFYSLTNYISHDSFEILKINTREGLIWGTIFGIVFLIKFFISVKIKSRLIYEIIDEIFFYSLILYNKTCVKLDKTLTPLYKEKADYFLNSLFSPNGTINLTPKNSERYIVEIESKKYYFLPLLFEKQVLI